MKLHPFFFFCALILFGCSEKADDTGKEVATEAVQEIAVGNNQPTDDNLTPYQKHKADLLSWQDERFEMWYVEYHAKQADIEFDEIIDNLNGDAKAILKDKNGHDKAFIYRRDEDLRMAADAGHHWYSWRITSDAENYLYYAQLEFVDLDGHMDEGGGKEIAVDIQEIMQPQSTFGSYYTGFYQIYDVDLFNLYFQAANYMYHDDYGRNGDQSYNYECRLDFDVSHGKLVVTLEQPASAQNIQCDIDTEKAGTYLLENFELVKQP